MKLVKKLLNKLDGLYYPQEFLCLAKETFQQPLQAWLSSDGKPVKDITNEHLFTGYSPLIITLCSSTVLPGEIEMILTNKPLRQNEFSGKKDAIASLSLKMTRKQIAGENTLYHFEGTRGTHRFISVFHQFIVGLANRMYNKKPGNVYLPGNLLKQVQVAYSVPRIISLITVGQGDLYNLFPTDLHGPVNEEFYICSLRQGGKACTQVEGAGRIVVSEVQAGACKTVYTLGKNHMQELKPKDNFPFGGLNSSFYQLPLPQAALRYRELELIESFTHGIHKVLLFKIISRQVISEEPATLCHLHNCYASWRHKQRIPSNFLLR